MLSTKRPHTAQCDMHAPKTGLCAEGIPKLCIGGGSVKSMYWFLLLIPVALAVHFQMSSAHTLVFALSAASMIPLAHLLSQATENLSARTGPTIGALLNVTFGNAGELLIGFFAP